ncbi:CRTAC1 family protein [Candidatus Pelagibacter communis]|uniref:CRTAC1 family protein n=1 Tax=Pelagibacter ubique TaxID=198252 RepID=UPI00094C22AF|nr:CRTAC1 family protein [Candidatus Pelagibacter ubique]
MKKLFIFLLIFLNIVNYSKSDDFFEDITYQILENQPRLSYGVSVSDVNNDGNFEFIVTGFGFNNLALAHKKGILFNSINQSIFIDKNRKTIGVASCDIDQDGYEEIYFLNTDTYSGNKRYSDRLLDFDGNKFFDLFELEINQENLNLTAGRSVVCVDRNGNGAYGIYVANYGGPTRFYEKDGNEIIDKASKLGIDKITGGRAVISGNILSGRSDIFAANERGENFLYYNNNGNFVELAKDYAVDDTFQNGRGTALSDIYYRGRLDILTSNWEGPHRAFVLKNNKFVDIADKQFSAPSRIRTVISADFDNDGYDEVFMNNIGEPNKLFKILDNGEFKEINIGNALETNGLGTGAAVADIDGDGILELLISHGESGYQPLTLYKANSKKNNFLRIKPINMHGAPARGATVTLVSNLRTHSKTIDSGSGYLCQMEPVAHYGIRKNERNIKIIVTWTNGEENTFEINELNKTLEIKQNN